MQPTISPKDSRVKKSPPLQLVQRSTDHKELLLLPLRSATRTMSKMTAVFLCLARILAAHGAGASMVLTADLSAAHMRTGIQTGTVYVDV